MERTLMMDCGDAVRRADNACFAKGPVASKADFTISKYNVGTMYTNRGATGAVTATLPAAIKGGWYAFACPTAQTFTVTASGGAKIDGGAGNGSVVVPVGGLMRMASDGTDWFAMVTLAALPLSSLAHGTNGQLPIAQTGDAVAYKAMSGDATIDKDGVCTLADGLIHSASVTLTNAQLKNLRATPITLVAAPGANKVLAFISATLVLKAGANVLTEAAANLGIKFNNGAGVQVSNDIECTGFIDQAADTITDATPKTDAIVAAAAAVNKALVLHNLGAGEFGANAAADATLMVHVAYRVRPTA